MQGRGEMLDQAGKQHTDGGADKQGRRENAAYRSRTG